ncbi:MAG: hypothetical protein ABSB38_08155 [Dehalococcoidia bacterium]
MTNKTYKFVTVLMVMLLVLGLALVACKAPAETVTPPAPPEQQATPPAEQQATPPAEQPATPPAAHQLTYTAKTYTNSQYGFSIQYPKDWVERPEIANGSLIIAFGVPGFVPGVSMSVRDANEPMTADWVVAANTAEGNTKVKVTSPPTETTLFDGTPAVQYVSKFTSGQYDIVSFATSTDKNGKRIRATVWTIDAFSPYDEALFSEIAHTLSVK